MDRDEVPFGKNEWKPGKRQTSESCARQTNICRAAFSCTAKLSALTSALEAAVDDLGLDANQSRFIELHFFPAGIIQQARFAATVVRHHAGL